jgi:nitrate reductase gamma subunit
MDLLDWARGPLLYGALTVFIVGVGWRALAFFRLPAAPVPVAPPRQAFGRVKAMSAALTRSWPRRGLPQSATLVTLNPYVFHIGLALVFLGYAPHIAFIRRLTGLGWPALPDMVMYLSAAATIISLLLALMFRLTDPVLRKISRADDMVTWAVTMLPLVTGMAVVGASPSDYPLYKPAFEYRDPIALHLLSLELLLVWFPFGKLMHAFLVLPARMQLATFLGRRGVPP